MRALRLAVVLLTWVAVPAFAQLAAPQQPSKRLLVLPFTAATADSATSIQLGDALRDRLIQLVKGKVLVVPKAKLCEALKASGFPCDILLDDQQARQLARFLNVDAYLTGSLEHGGAGLVANVRLIDIKSSGIAASFTLASANPGTPAALADEIAQKVAIVVRASDAVNDCNEERKKSAFGRARAAAQKALTIDPNSTGAHLCLATVYEAQRMPVDSMIAESQRALKGDSLNGTAWENIARGYQQKGDTAKMLDAFIQQLRGEPRNTPKRLGIAQLLRQMKKSDQAIQVLDEGLKYSPGDSQLLELKLTICTEASNFRCALDVWVAKSEHDTATLGDTTFLKPAIGAAQSVTPPDSQSIQALLKFTAAAVQHFPNNLAFLRARAGAFETAGMTDSSVAIAKQLLSRDPNDVSASLQIAKALIDRATFDTAAARVARTNKDSVTLKNMQQTFGAKVDSARPYLHVGLASKDSTQQLAAVVIMLTGGSKLAQAGAYDRAYTWLDSLLNIIGYTPKSAADTVGPKQQVRINASFWYGLSSVLTLNGPYKAMTEEKNKTKRCEDARAVFGRLERTKHALQLGRRVHPPTVDQMLGFVAQYEKAKEQVQKSFKCSPAL